MECALARPLALVARVRPPEDDSNPVFQSLVDRRSFEQTHGLQPKNGNNTTPDLVFHCKYCGPEGQDIYDLSLTTIFWSTAINRNNKQKSTGTPITQMSLAIQIMNS